MPKKTTTRKADDGADARVADLENRLTALWEQVQRLAETVAVLKAEVEEQAE